MFNVTDHLAGLDYDRYDPETDFGPVLAKCPRKGLIYVGKPSAKDLAAVAGEELPTDLLAWTTTPWTLPANLALAVGPDLDYAVFLLDGRRVILGDATAAKYAKELAHATRVASCNLSYA